MGVRPVFQRFGAALAVLGLLGAAGVGLPVRAEIDVRTASVTDERLPSGVPLGGIGAGKVDLLTDGTFGNLTLNNNWDRPIAELPASFFAIRTKSGGKSDARVLALRSGYGLPTVSSVQYQGIFPRATARFSDPNLPLEVNLHAHSSLIPQNLKESSIPAASFTFTLSNPTDAPVETDLAFSWENLIGVGGTAKEAWSDRTGNVQEARTADGRTGLLFTTTRKQEGMRQNALGEYALLAETDGGKIAVLPFWDASGSGEDFWTSFAGPTLFGEKPAAMPGRESDIHPAGAVAASVTIPPQGTREVHFVLGWHFPRHLTADGADHGHAYANRFPDAWSAAAYAAQYRDTLLSGTTQWQELLLKSDLPAWLRFKLLNDAFPLFSNTLLTKENRFAMLESPTDPEGAIGALDQWLLSRTLLAQLFPSLDRDELNQYTELQAVTGEPRRLLGTLTEGFGTVQSPPGSRDWPDVACNYILAVYRLYRWTGDPEGLKAQYPSVTRSLGWLASRDTDGDAIPEGGSTWTYQNVPGTFSYTASLYLAALRAGEAMAAAQADRKTEAECRARFDEVKANAMAQLWNGRFFTKGLNPETADRSNHLFAGALAGEWAGEQLGLPELYNRRVVDTALRSLVELLPAAAPFCPPNEVRADGSLAPELSDRSWAGHLETFLGSLAIARNRADAGLDVIRQFHEVQYRHSRSPWDASLGYHPRTAERLGPRSHLATLGSWNGYAALTGFTLDEPGGKLAVAPNLPTAWSDLRAPLFAPRYWAWMDFARNPNNAATNLRLKLLKKFDDRPVVLNALTTTAPVGANLADLTLLVTGPAGPIEGRAEIREGRVQYAFKTPFEWRLGETIEMSVVPPEANKIVVSFSPNRITSYGSAVLPKNLEKDERIRFTLVNPTRERQVVHVHFRGIGQNIYEFFQNGVEMPRFTQDTKDEALTLVVPASPMAYERVVRLREIDRRLRALREQAEREGKLPALESQVSTLQERVRAAVQADELARSTQVVLHPYRKGIVRNKLKDRPPVVTPVDPEPQVVAAEEAVAQAAQTSAEQIPDASARNMLLAALHPVKVELTPLGEAKPNGEVRFRVEVENQTPQTVRAVVDLDPPQGWSTPAIPPQIALAPGETGRVEVPVRLPAALAPKREQVSGRVVLTQGKARWELPLTARLGHAYLRDWSLIGPWSVKEAASLDAKLPPDTELDPAASYEGRRWRVLRSAGDRVDLAALAPEAEKGVVYAVTQVFSPVDQDAALELKTDGGALVKVNGERVYQRQEPRGGEVERVPIRLRQGSNLLLLKLARTADAWGFQAEITDPQGNTPAGLRFNPELGR